MLLQGVNRHMSLPAMRPALFVFALFYLAFHMLHGERGVFAFIHSYHEMELVEQQIEVTTRERQTLERRVRGLRISSLDMDLLDEQSRNMLGMASEDEFMVILPPTNP